MNRGSKLIAGRDRRIADWEALSAQGFLGTNTKVVRRDGKGTAAFHKPGSANGRKGYGKRKKVGKK